MLAALTLARKFARPLLLNRSPGSVRGLAHLAQYHVSWPREHESVPRGALGRLDFSIARQSNVAVSWLGAPA